jgi:hypothetical protein
MPKRTQRVQAYPARRLGFWSAIFTAVFAAVAFGLGIFTPVRSGPNCAGNCIGYPYTNAAAFVPRDYLWMYPALLMVFAFVILLACVYIDGIEQRRVFGLIALAFSVMCATAIAIDYFIQLVVIQPSLLKGETAGLSLFTQYNPHGIFLGMEDLGYLMLSVAFLFVGLAIAGRSRLERAAHWLFIAAAVLVVGALLGLALLLRENLADRFEITAIAITWITLIVGGILLSFIFRRAGRQTPDK